MNAPQFDNTENARALSPDVESRLTASLKAHASQPTEQTANALKAALDAAARDARARQLRSEELLIVFKAIEQSSGALMRDDKSAMSRNKLIKALLDSYYTAQGAGSEQSERSG